MASTYDQHQGQEPPPNSSSFLPPVSSYNYAQRQRNTFAYEDTVAAEHDAENPVDVPLSPHVSSALSAPALTARLSSQSSKVLPPASELLLSSASRSTGTSNSISTNNRNNNDSPGAKNCFTNALPSVTSLTNSSILSQQQSQVSLSVPPSPYLNTPSTYCSLTEPGTPVSQLYNEYGLQALSPSLPASMHSSNPASIISSVPPSPVSSLQRSPSAKSVISNRMGPTPTPDNQPSDYQAYLNQAGTSSSGADLVNTSRSFSQHYTVQQGNSKTISFSPSSASANGSAVGKPSGIYKSSSYSSRSANRGKNSSNFSPVLQYKMGVDDGPTVKEHLQQQARHRMRQDILSKRTMDDEHVRPGLLVKRSNLRSSVSPQKVYLQPPQQIQSAQPPQVLYSSDGMVISSHQYDSASIRYSSSQPAKETLTLQSIHLNNASSAASTWSSSTSNNSQSACGPDSTDHHQSATFADTPSSANEHSNSATANSDDLTPVQSSNANLNDALASTIASVASGASGSLVDPGELLLDSSFGGGNSSDIDDDDEVTDVDDLDDDDGHVEYYSGNCSTKSCDAPPLPPFSSVFGNRGNELDGDSSVSGVETTGRGAGVNPSERPSHHHHQQPPTYYIHQKAISSHPQQSVDSSRGSSLASSSPVSHQTGSVIPVSSPAPRRSRGGSSVGVTARKRNGQPSSTRGRGANKGTTRRQATNKGTKSIVVDQPFGAPSTPMKVMLDRHDSLRRAEDDSRQQCRIHVQNPPSNAACSFPPTETTIHVVQHSRFQSAAHNNFYRNQKSSSSSQPPNSVVSVQQHPSVAHTQQRQHHNQQQDAIDAERMRNIVVQRENNGVVVGSEDITAIEAPPPPHTRRQQQQHNSGSSTASSSTAELQQLLQSKRQVRVSPSRNMSSPPASNPAIVLNHTQHYQQPTVAAKLVSIKSPPPYHMVASSTQMMSSVSPPNAYHSVAAATAATHSPVILTGADAVQQQHSAGFVALPPPSAVDQQMDAEFRNYSLKLHHLRRTVKALVYKNGALSDELARLCQRISTVTEERRMLSKRLQHHERNKIRRIQTKHRKAAAAAAAASVVKAPPASAGPTAANSMTHSPASTNESFAMLDDTKESVLMRSGGGRNSLDALEHRINCADMKPLCVNTSTSDVEMKSPFTSHTTSRNCTPKISPSRPHSAASQHHHQQNTGGNFGKMCTPSGLKFQGAEEREDGISPDADYDRGGTASTSGGSLMMTLRSRSSSSTDQQHHQQRMNHQQQPDAEREGGGVSGVTANELVSPRPGTRSSTRLSAERALTVGGDNHQQQLTPTQGRATRYSARQQQQLQQKMLEKQQCSGQSTQEFFNTSGGIAVGSCGSDSSGINDDGRVLSRRRSRSATKKGDSISPRALPLAVDTSTSMAEHNLSPRTRFSSRLNPTVVAGAPARSEEPSAPLKRRLVRSTALLINGAGRCSLEDEESSNVTCGLASVDDGNDEHHTVRIRSVNHHHSLEASDNEDYDDDIYDDETTPPRSAPESGDGKTTGSFVCENNATKANMVTRQRQQSGTKKAK